MAKPPKLPKLKFVKFVRSKGKVYAYFNTGKIADGKLVWTALPPFSSPGFYDSYSTCLGHRSRKTHQAHTVATTIDAYMAHDDYTTCKPSTQKVYRGSLNRIRKELGDFELGEVGRAELQEILDNRLSGPGSRNMFLSVMNIIYAFARHREWTKARPTEGFKMYETGEHAPWPESLLVQALAAEDDMVRLGTHLLYYTGQRIGDVLKMRWTDIVGNRLSLQQTKTAKDLSIPLHSNLLAELQKTPKRGFTILANWRGQKISDDTLRPALQAFAAKLGHAIVPHGLRKNAVITLLESGCTVAEVASITGQTYQVVEYYARQVDQRRLSDAAILKFEGAQSLKGRK